MKKICYLLSTFFFLLFIIPSTWAVSITVQLRDSDGMTLADANTATLKYYDGGWSNATNDGSGNFNITSSSASVTYKMYYHNGIQQKVIPTTTTTVVFNTVTVTPALETSGSSPLVGTVKHYQNGWTGSYAANSTVELLPGSYTFKMYYNNGTQQKSGVMINFVPSQTVQFTTVTVTPALETSGGTQLGGTVKHYQNGWSGSYASNSTTELLPGNYTFKMYYNNGTQQKNGVAIVGPGSQEVLFETITVTPALKTTGGTQLTGTVKHYQNGWSGSYASNSTTELLPGNYTFKMYYNNGTQQKNGVAIVGPGSQEVLFETITVTPALKTTGGTQLTGTVKHYQNGWSGSYASNSTTELLPGNYTFKMYYNNGTQQKNGVGISDPGSGSQEVLFETVTVTAVLEDCDNNPVAGGTVKHYQNGWSGSYGANTPTELLPGNYTFKMYLNNGTKQKNSIAISGASQDVVFDVTKVALTFDGTIKIYQNGWLTYSNPTYLLPGDYTFKFSNTYQEVINISGCEWEETLFIFLTKKHDGSPLPNMVVKRNDYGNHFVTVGTTNTDGVLFASNVPAGPWKFRVTKNYSYKDITSGPNVLTFQTSRYLAHVTNSSGADFENIEVEYNDYGNHWIDLDPKYTDVDGNSSIQLFPGEYDFRAKKNYSIQEKTKEILSSGTTGVIEFQTSKYVAHVTNSTGGNFAGIEVEYNDYGNHWIDLSPKFTDANGNSHIELFPGEYDFRAKKNYSIQEKSHEITTSGTTGTVEFQTSEYIAHVKKHDGTNFAGIEVEYNDYGNHWIDLSPKYTNASGNSSIELFPGDFDFRAKKNYSIQENSLEILSSGTSDIVEFQTSLAIGLVKDCDSNTPVSGIEIEYNDYGNHWIDLSPKYTGVDGKSSIELFPGTYDLRAKNLRTVKEMEIVLEPVGVSPTTTVEFNPTRVCLNYTGTVKYNDYGNHWVNLPCDSYMFPGTYDFRFYTGSTIDLQQSIAISGCVFEKALIFVQLKNSLGNGLSNADFDYRFGWGSYTNIGVDNTGDGIWAFIDGNPGNTKVKVTYEGASKEIQQNVQSNNQFIFNTVLVTADLQESDNDDITASATWEYRYGWGSHTTFDPVAGIERLPVNTKVKVTYEGASVEKQQNVASNSHFDFNTVLVTADLQESDNDDITAGATWEYRYGWGSHTAFDPVAGIERLPVNTKVKVTYEGASVEKQQNASSNSHFDFNTVLVTADLQESDNDDITTSATWEYRYGWGSHTAFDPVAGIERLPVNTKVKVSYKGASVEKQQNVSSSSHFDFNTVSVTASLMDGATDLTLDPGTNWEYRYGWGSYASLDPSGEELLPVNTKVKVTYMGDSDEKQQNVGSNSSFAFFWNGSSISRLDVASTFKAPELNVYPNPAYSKTMLDVTLHQDDKVYLAIFDMSGKMIQVLHEGVLLEGTHKFKLNFTDQAEGTYICRMVGKNGVTNKMIIVNH